MIRIGIYGAAGYAGQELVAILAQHPQVSLEFATSGSQRGEMLPGGELRYIAPGEADPAAVDAVFLALPHGASAPVAERALAKGARVIDLSADFRIDDATVWSAWYKIPHPCPQLLPAPCGLPELHRAALVDSDLVAIPGCYPTTALLGLYPLLRAGALASGAAVIIDAKSGASGAGRTPSALTHFPELFGNLVPYKTGRAHRLVAELDQEIQRLDDRVGPVIFTPHLLPVDRGLMASLYVTLAEDFVTENVRPLYEEIYGGEQLVRLLPAGQEATLQHVTRSNHCVISLGAVVERWLHITSVSDNLRKGAASQAVQVFNLMFGLPETTALLPEAAA